MGPHGVIFLRRSPAEFRTHAGPTSEAQLCLLCIFGLVYLVMSTGKWAMPDVISAIGVLPALVAHHSRRRELIEHICERALCGAY